MANDYLDNLQRELEMEGIVPSSPSVVQKINMADDNELRHILRMEQVTGVKYSAEQRALLEHHGNACILACAGSGKTTVSTHLIAKRILTGEIKDVNKLIYTTYSKAGKVEMKERLDKLLKQLDIHVDVEVRTLHSFFLQVIRIFGVTSNIINAGTRSQYVKESCKEAEFLPKDDELMIIDNLLSYQVNNLLGDRKTIESPVNTLESLSVEQYTKIRVGYANRKAKHNLIDYDDMQSLLYLWLVKYAKSSKPEEVQIAESVRNYCKAMWTDFYIDEAQDVSKIQFAIIRAMVTDPNDKNKLTSNLVFIGDDDQCLIEGTKIITEDGLKNIEDVQYMDKIKSCTGHGDSDFISVDNGSKKEIDDDIVVIHTKSGKEIKGTYNHIGFAKIVPRENEYYTYLMYRHDFGFRVGTTSGVRAGIRKGIVNGIEMRLMQERSDKVWILKVCDTENESRYWEAYFAYKYSIPMYRFVTSDSGSSLPYTSLDSENVKRLHRELNTFENGLRLLDDLRMDYKYPHRVPQAEGDRCRIGFSMFGSGQTNKCNIHKSEVSVNSSNLEYIDITSNYLSTTDRTSKTKYNYFNSRMTTCDTDLELKIINNILDDCKEADIYVEPSYSAKLTTGKNFLFMPFGNMIKGMVVPVCDENGNIVEDEIISVEREHYKGYVYDLSLTQTRNFIANGVVVHNCIYVWRGSDPSIILTIGATFNMPVFKLTTNYRCLSEIVDYATTGIKCNGSRFDKGMQAFNKGGSVKIYPLEKNDLCTYSNAAMNHIKWWLKQCNKLSDIAVLSRNNFHLALLNNMLLREGIYCNITDDMKITKSPMYQDIKILIDICVPCWRTDLTQKVLWKLCRYMGAGNAKVIADFQNASALSLEDTLGYLVKNYINRNIEYDKKLNIPLEAEQRIKYYMETKLSSDTKNDMYLIYQAIISESKEEALKTLMFQYKQATSFLYKTKDSKRSVEGLAAYISMLLAQDGYEKMTEFLRVTEQLENGSMVIPGEKITLTTVHSAKGREWKNVIMFAVDNIAEPSFDSISKMLDDNISINDIFQHLDEERRLFYVGNTRAKENLVTLTSNEPSVFILEALNVIENKQCGTNDIILECANDSGWYEKYREATQSIILDKNNKYFYDINDYALN